VYIAHTAQEYGTVLLWCSVFNQGSWMQQTWADRQDYNAIPRFALDCIAR